VFCYERINEKKERKKERIERLVMKDERKKKRRNIILSVCLP